MNKRKLRLSRYGISENRYTELQAFCLQYPEWKEELKEKNCVLGSPNFDGLPKGTKNSDTTAKLAIRRAILCEKCYIIETSIEEAGTDLAKYLMLSVCEGKAFSILKRKYHLPCEQSCFYDMRRYFFYLLDQKLQNFEEKSFLN